MPEEQRYDDRLLQSVCRTPWEPNPGDVSTDLPEPMLIIPQLPDVDPAPTKTYHNDNKATRNGYIRKTDLEKFGYSAGFFLDSTVNAVSTLCQDEKAEKQTISLTTRLKIATNR